jgi:hypothetical protein
MPIRFSCRSNRKVDGGNPAGTLINDWPVQITKTCEVLKLAGFQNYNKEPVEPRRCRGL